MFSFYLFMVIYQNNVSNS